MPSIIINERDLTSGGGRATNTNVVYVPGYMALESTDGAWPDESIKNAAKKGVPTLCSTIAEFETYFGKRPAEFVDATTSKKKIDKSYLYAKELLRLGLPVLYESVNAVTATTIADEDITKALNGDSQTDSILTKLEDKGSYQFKYLTSGAYPNFKLEATSETVDRGTNPNIYYSTTLGTSLDITSVADTDAGNTGDRVFVLTYKGETTDESGKTQGKWILTKADGESFKDKENNKLGTFIECTSSIITYTQNDTTSSCVVISTKDKKNIVAIDGDYELVTSDTLSCTINGEDEVYEFDPVEVKEQDVNSNLALQMATVAYNRGDCLALIDHSDDEKLELTGSNSIHSLMSKFASRTLSSKADYCAAFTPWVNVNFTTYKFDEKTTIKDNSMPPSFAYLSAFAQSLKTNASWLAVAGAARGQVPNLDADEPLNITTNLTNAIAEQVFQNRNAVSINAITDIKPFGYRIWGNRTLKDNSLEGNLTATSFLNIRNLICDVKKVVWDACRRYTFEQNNDVLWVNFKSYIEPTLNQMKTGAGLSGYKIIKGETTEKAKLVAQIKLYPLYAVEDFTVEVQLLDDEIAVS